ncbi:MAG: hypothetical protein A2542_02185 [Parcubacteria group bacterium RIFOXYD2_FULL_52_8]|nr:MAG: hypothetical protein A2542_02185 [Parcubacteria group bacterium RIFOXYD2_FULL_52_8]
MLRNLLWVVLVLLVAWGIYALVQKQRAQAPQGAMGTESAYAVVAGDQPAENQVLVNAAKLPTPGFVLVHKMENNAPGKVIGASPLLVAGNHMGLPITLTETPKAGDLLYVMLHNDDNNNGTLEYINDPSQDTPAVDEQSQVVMTIVTLQ